MGKQWELTDFIFWGFKITIGVTTAIILKRQLLLGRKATTNPDCILQKQRHHFADKGLYSQSFVFPVVMYGCERWTIKKAENRRIDAFKLWCWRRLLRVLWTARRSNQSIQKEINREYSLEGLMLKLKLQYLGHMMWRANSIEKTLLLKKTEGRRRRGNRGWLCWMVSPTQWAWIWVNSRR